MRKLFIILTIILSVSLILVSCSEKPDNSGAAGDEGKKETTADGKFPAAFNNRTFKLKRDTSARDASTENIDYFYISTEDSSLYVDLHVNSYTEGGTYNEAQVLSSSTEVVVTVSDNSCTATAGDTTYTFTRGTDDSVDIVINGAKNNVINGTFTTSVAETAANWPIRFEKYEDVSQDSVAVRFLFTPVGVYYVMSSNQTSTNPVEWKWVDGVKDYHLFLLKNIKVTDDGFVCRMMKSDNSVIRTLTFTKAGEGYTLVMTGDVTSSDFTFNLTKAVFDPSFMFNPEIRMYDSFPEE